jgi:hypothetical protein
MFETNLTRQQAQLICEALDIDTLVNISHDDAKLLKKQNPELFKAYIALHEYAYN